MTGLATAVEVVRAGGIVGLPTDTVYGVGVDPTNEEAVAALFELKGRPQGKPIGILVASMEQASMVGDMSGAAGELARMHWPGALTMVVPSRVVLSDWVGDRQSRTVGLRMPDHPIALALLEAAGPMSVTSANRSGEPDTLDHVAAREVLGDSVFYVEGSSPGGRPSTVVDLTGAEPVVLREGPVVLGN